jgi:hypothetical protein
LVSTDWQNFDRFLQLANFLKMRTVMVVSVQFHHLDSISDVSRVNFNTCKVSVQLGTEDRYSFWW